MGQLISDLITSMALEIGEAASDTDYQTLLLSWIQEACDTIFNFTDWGSYLITSEQINTINGTATYSTAVNVRDIVAMSHKNTDFNIELTSRAELQRLNADLELKGLPIAFYDAGYDPVTNQSSFSLYPVPDQVYTMLITEEKQSVTLLTTDRLPFPQAFNPAVREFIRSKAFMNEGGQNDASNSINMFFKHLNQLKKRVVNPAKTGRLQVSDISKPSAIFAKLNPAHFQNN